MSYSTRSAFYSLRYWLLRSAASSTSKRTWGRSQNAYISLFVCLAVKAVLTSGSLAQTPSMTLLSVRVLLEMERRCIFYLQPRFGDLWEAGVSSSNRVLGSPTPTMEELSPSLCEVESCLNSRPLMPLSDTTNDVKFSSVFGTRSRPITCDRCSTIRSGVNHKPT